MPGDEIPKLGLGTWQNTDADQCAESVRTALELGYRHIDTAQAYGNEEHVGRGLAEADLDRDEVFLATKVWKDNLAPDDVHASTNESLDELGVDFVDLLYVHWPADDYDPAETLAAFDELQDGGKIRNIGVSNFLPEQLDEARELTEHDVLANQVEMHPLLQQEELQAYAKEHDMYLVAYSPLARGEVTEAEEIREVAEKHDASPQQVSLAWLLSKENVVAIPKATSEEHIRDNYGALSLDLDEEDVERIDGIEAEDRQVDPDFAPWQ